MARGFSIYAKPGYGITEDDVSLILEAHPSGIVDSRLYDANIGEWKVNIHDSEIENFSGSSLNIYVDLFSTKLKSFFPWIDWVGVLY